MEESNIVYKKAYDVRPDDYLMLDDHPCKIVMVSMAGDKRKKYYFLGIDIFTDKKHEVIHMSSDVLQVINPPL